MIESIIKEMMDQTNTVVWKFKLPVNHCEGGNSVVIEVPMSASILSIQAQGPVPGSLDGSRQPVMWMRVNPKGEKEKRTFLAAATGQEAAFGNYIGTAQLRDDYVLHYFEITEILKRMKKDEG